MDLYKNAIIMKVLSRLLCLVLCLPLLVMGQEKITWDKDGKEMVLIPAGSFEMGDHHDNMSNALPVHTVELDEFYMDVNEVTVGQFKQFVEASGYKPDVMMQESWSANKYWQEVAQFSPTDEHPMIYVTWYDAMVYAGSGQSAWYVVGDADPVPAVSDRQTLADGCFVTSQVDLSSIAELRMRIRFTRISEESG